MVGDVAAACTAAVAGEVVPAARRAVVVVEAGARRVVDVVLAGAGRAMEVDDGAAGVSPGATEVCDDAGVDEDCDGVACSGGDSGGGDSGREVVLHHPVVHPVHAESLLPSQQLQHPLPPEEAAHVDREEAPHLPPLQILDHLRHHPPIPLGHQALLEVPDGEFVAHGRGNSVPTYLRMS